MKRSKFDETNDQRAANDESTPKHLMCSARGCPNRWSTSDGNLCRWHADAEPHRWPEVTQQQQWDETERARMRGAQTLPPPHVSARQKREILDRLRTVLTEPKDQRAWLRRLRERDASGERLSPMRRHALHECRHIPDQGAEA